MNTKTTTLFSSHKTGPYTLNHRIVLAPMTRIRADENTLSPTTLTAEYYSQRATPGGLLITEAVHISPEATPIWTIYSAVREHGGQVPGIWTDEQTEQWKTVTAAVHNKKGKICCQLLHTGRIAQPEIKNHPLVKNSGLPIPPVSSSALAIPASDEEGNHYNWDQDSTIPKALTVNEIKRVCNDYKQAANNALCAGFDYVELHAAHGYLMDQFICDGVNQRTDQYGGSIENRCRILFEVVETLVHVMGAGRVGVRLSPLTSDPVTGLNNQTYFGASCSDPAEIYHYAINGLNHYPLAYLLLTEPRVGGLSLDPEQDSAYRHPLCNAKFRDIYQGTLMAAGGFTPLTAAQAITDGTYDLIAFGRWFLANPDLPYRIEHGYPLNVYHRDTFYGGQEEGYTDYPTWDELQSNQNTKYRLMDQTEIGCSLSQNQKL